MPVYIVKAKKTTLRSPLSSTDTTVKLSSLVDSNDNPIVDASVGDWFVLVLKSGDTVEMVKCDGITQNVDGTVDVDVATDGRLIDPIPPYSGYADGLDFQTAEVIITNDPLTMAQFANLNNDQTVNGKLTFATAKRPALATDTDTAVDEEFPTFGQLYRTAIAGAVNADETHAGIVKQATVAQVLAGTEDDGAGVKFFVSPDVLQVILQGGQMLYAVEDGSGSDDTYTWTTTPVTTALSAGSVRRVKLTVANTTVCTGNENGLGAKTFKKYASGALTDLETGDIIANMTAYILYDGTYFILLNPTGAVPSTAILNEMATFFGSTDITPTEAETLSSGPTSNASALHNHDLYELAKNAVYNGANLKTLIGGFGDGLTEENDTSSAVKRTFSATLLDCANTENLGIYGQLGTKIGDTNISWDGNPNVNLFARMKVESVGNANMMAFFGLDDGIPSTDVIPADVLSNTVRHVAFVWKYNKLYASVANGTTQTTSDVTGSLTLTNLNDFEIVMTGGSQAVFKVNGNVVATLTTNFPTTAGDAEGIYFLIGMEDDCMEIQHPFAVKVTN